MFRLRVDTVIRSSSSLQDASVSGPALRRQWEHFTPCVRTPRGLNGSQQLREPPQNFCCHSRTAGGRVRGSFLLKPVASGGVSSQRYWSVCPAMSRGVLAEQVCSVQHSSVPELRGRLGHPAGAGCPAGRAVAVGRRCHGTSSVHVPLPRGTSGCLCHRPEFPSPCLPLGIHVTPGEAPGRALAARAQGRGSPAARWKFALAPAPGLCALAGRAVPCRSCPGNVWLQALRCWAEQSVALPPGQLQRWRRALQAPC